jgi:hypothetical protein
MSHTASPPPPTDWPLYWFAQLDRAVDDRDFQAAAEAQRQLARLGIEVKYGRPEREAVADAR